MIWADPAQVGQARPSSVEPAAFRAAMARFPSGVTIVTTRDGAGRPWGFTASSFCSVSLDPPLILVCLARSANCHPAFAACDGFAISILQSHHAELARRFASRAADKFAHGPFTRLPSGIEVVEGSLAVLECTVHERVDAGDHTIIVARVCHAAVCSDGKPAVYVDRLFTTIW